MAARKTPGKGTKSDKPWRDALMLAVHTRDKDNRPRLRAIAEMCVTKALEGDSALMKEIGDRLDGKPHQSIATTAQVTITSPVDRPKRETREEWIARRQRELAAMVPTTGAAN